MLSAQSNSPRLHQHSNKYLLNCILSNSLANVRPNPRPKVWQPQDQTQQKVLRVEAELSAIKSYFKCELSTLNIEIESITPSLDGALKNLENQPHKCCSIVEDNLLFLQKELLSKNNIIKSLVETQTEILDSISSTTSDKQTPMIL